MRLRWRSQLSLSSVALSFAFAFDFNFHFHPESSPTWVPLFLCAALRPPLSLSLSRSRCGNFLCGLPVLFSQLIRPPAGALVLRAAPPRKVCYARSLLIFPRRPAGATLLPLLLLRAVIMAVRCKDQGRSRKSTAKNENKNKPEKKKQSQGKVNRKKCRALAFVRMVWSFLGRMTLTRVAGFEWGT